MQDGAAAPPHWCCLHWEAGAWEACAGKVCVHRAWWTGCDSARATTRRSSLRGLHKVALTALPVQPKATCSSDSVATAAAAPGKVSGRQDMGRRSLGGSTVAIRVSASLAKLLGPWLPACPPTQMCGQKEGEWDYPVVTTSGGWGEDWKIQLVEGCQKTWGPWITCGLAMPLIQPLSSQAIRNTTTSH